MPGLHNKDCQSNGWLNRYDTDHRLRKPKRGCGENHVCGAALANRGARILLVDIDPQGNSTSHLGLEKANLPVSLYDVLVRDLPISEVIHPTGRPNLDIVPALPALAGAEVELINVIARETLLRRALQSVHTQYDYILIDPPPSLGLLTVNALTAARYVVIPVQAEYLALEGLSCVIT